MEALPAHTLAALPGVVDGRPEVFVWTGGWRQGGGQKRAEHPAGAASGALTGVTVALGQTSGFSGVFVLIFSSLTLLALRLPAVA